MRSRRGRTGADGRRAAGAGHVGLQFDTRGSGNLQGHQAAGAGRAGSDPRRARTEQDLFEALTVWARRQFEPGIPEPYPLSNGLDILTDIRAGKTGGFCGQYAYLLADALKSFGYFDVRYVETWADEKRSHFLVEVWSNQHASWMLLDPLYAATVVDEAGAPQSTWDVHTVAAGRGRAAVRRKWLAPAGEVPREPDAKYFELFRLPAISLRSNLAREMAPWSIAGRQAQFLALRDDANADLLPGYYRQESNREDDFRAARNLCRIEVDPTEEGHIVRLDNLGTCAHFWKFLIRLDGGDWRDAEWETRLREPFRVLDCWTVNRMGVRGVITRLALPDRPS